MLGLGLLWLLGDLVHRSKDDEEEGNTYPGPRPDANRHGLHRFFSSAFFFQWRCWSIPSAPGAGGMASGGHRAAEHHCDHHRAGQARSWITCRWWRPPWVCTTSPPIPWTVSVGIHGLLRRHGRVNPDHRSAAGVAAMGLEKIDFFWYARRISLPALLGYAVGAAAYMIQYGIATAKKKRREGLSWLYRF